VVSVAASPGLQNLLSASDARAVLVALLDILTTILAISVSLIVVSLQFVSQVYTSRMLRTLFSDNIFVGYLLAYASAIFLVSGVVMLDLLPPQTFLVYAYAILVFCVIYLIVLLLHLPTTIHPSSVVQRVANSVVKDFCSKLIKRAESGHITLGSDDEPFLALEQIMIRSITENDFPTFVQAVRFLESILTSFLNDVKLRFAKEQKSEVRELPSSVFPYFLPTYRQLAMEAISNGRELHLTYLCDSLGRLMGLLHEVKAFRAIEWTAEVYDYCGKTGLEKRLLTFEDDYCKRGLRTLVVTQSSILDGPIFPFEGAEQYSKLSEEERHLRADDHILYDFVFRPRLNFVSEIATTASDSKLNSIVDSCMFILSSVLDKTLSLNPIERKKGVLTTLIMPIILKTHKQCVDHGISSTTFTTDMLHYKITNMQKELVPELGIYLASMYAEMGIYSIEKGFVSEAYAWGVNARYLIKDFPEIAEIAIIVLVKTLKFLKGKNDDESRAWYSLTRYSLDGLRKWENHGHTQITKKINRELAKYPALK
jgi:hypothetical protein